VQHAPFLEAGDGSAGQSTGHLVAYIGMGTVTHRSEVSTLRGGVTARSNWRCFFRASRRSTTPSAVPTWPQTSWKQAQRSPRRRCEVLFSNTREHDSLSTKPSGL